MSHFCLVVILPPDTEVNEAKEELAELLAPYDESLKVDEYLKPCWCINMKAQSEVAAVVKAEFDIKALRETFHSLPQNERTEEKWHELIRPMVERHQQLLAEHPLKDKPDSNCQKCGGIGEYITTYNPNSKWDFWSIGGRWDGWLYGPERERQSRDNQGGFNFGEEHHRIGNNSRLVRDIPIEDRYYVPLAVLTPDGEWHQQGQMGWWAMVHDAVDIAIWHETVKGIYAQYPDCLALALDCHI